MSRVGVCSFRTVDGMCHSEMFFGGAQGWRHGWSKTIAMARQSLKLPFVSSNGYRFNGIALYQLDLFFTSYLKKANLVLIY